jgi:hypothetical protein
MKKCGIEGEHEEPVFQRGRLCRMSRGSQQIDSRVFSTAESAAGAGLQIAEAYRAQEYLPGRFDNNGDLLLQIIQNG